MSSNGFNIPSRKDGGNHIKIVSGEPVNLFWNRHLTR